MEEQITNNIPDGMGVTTEPAAESIAESAAVPVAESVAESVAEPFAESIAVPAAESIAESLPEGPSATDGAGIHVGLSDDGLVLRAEGLVKRYGKRTVVNDVAFDVKQGEIVGLLGPNGAGKTTSFYMTTGLVVPNGGHIYLGKEEITKLPVYKRARLGIGYLPQEASVFRKMSVEDNILSVLEMTGKPRDYQLEKLESLIREFSLQKVRKNLGDRLSGGERRRCEIARCLAIEPKFIMLDEPFAGVDPIAVEEIQEVVWHLKYRNIGILITDHNVQETLAITDRAYLLFEGRILFQGTPEELAADPIVRKNYLTDKFVLRKNSFQDRPAPVEG